MGVDGGLEDESMSSEAAEINALADAMDDIGGSAVTAVATTLVTRGGQKQRAPGRCSGRRCVVGKRPL